MCAELELNSVDVTCIATENMAGVGVSETRDTYLEEKRNQKFATVKCR